MKYLPLPLFIVVLFFDVSFSRAQVITTYAGTGVVGYSGDGGPATAAEFNSPHGIYLSSSGDLYVTEWYNNRIRKISASGIISTVAGNGIAGYSGDGGPATAAAIQHPFTVVMDTAGNLYFAEQANYRVRKINTAGIVTTIAGNGISGFSGDGGPATAASFGAPCGLALDGAGNLYVGDGNNHCVRKINSVGIITTVAGTPGVPGYSGDGGAATVARLNFCNYLHCDNAGNVYITDNGNHRIRLLHSSGIITTFAGNGLSGSSGDGGQATAAELDFPAGVNIDAAGNVYIAGDINQSVRMVNAAGIISTFAGAGTAGYSGDGGPATSAQFDNPLDITFDACGDMYVADNLNNVIRRISNPAATIAPVSGLSVLCQGSAISLTDATTGGAWTSSAATIATVSSSGTVTGLSAGTLTISYSACGLSASTVLTVEPSPATISGASSVSVGASVTLSDATAGGTWASGNTSVSTIGASSGIATGVSAGTTIITYTLPTGCSTETTLTVTLPSSVTPVRKPQSLDINLAPNPNTGQFTIHGFVAHDQEIALEISNLLGQVVYRDKIIAKAGKFDKAVALPQVKNGTYLLNVVSGGDDTVLRIVVDR